MKRLFCRKPTRLVVPPPPSILLSSSRQQYFISRPTKKDKDSPLATVYRIYWAIVMNDSILMRNEIEYFWTRKGRCWEVHNIPKPPDPDLERFTIVSAIPFILAAAFNRLINLGLPRAAAGGILTDANLTRFAKAPKVLERAAQWAEEAPPLEYSLTLPTADLGAPISADAEDADPFMARKNILIWTLHIYFT
nr:hypothetical protein CFP56_00302 [Quercus suber]